MTVTVHDRRLPLPGPSHLISKTSPERSCRENLETTGKTTIGNLGKANIHRTLFCIARQTLLIASLDKSPSRCPSYHDSTTGRS